MLLITESPKMGYGCNHLRMEVLNSKEFATIFKDKHGVSMGCDTNDKFIAVIFDSYPDRNQTYVNYFFIKDNLDIYQIRMWYNSCGSTYNNRTHQTYCGQANENFVNELRKVETLSDLGTWGSIPRFSYRKSQYDSGNVSYYTICALVSEVAQRMTATSS